MFYLTTRKNGLADFRQEMDHLFDDFWRMPTLKTEMPSTWAPSTDISEAEDHYLLSLEIPGMKKDELKIEVIDNQVVISGERKTEEKHERKGSLYSERRFGRFQRAFALPTHVDAGKIEAQYEDGVLNVYVPKSEAAKPRQIKIGDASAGGIFSRLLGKREEDRKTIDHAKGENVA